MTKFQRFLLKSGVGIIVIYLIIAFFFSLWPLSSIRGVATHVTSTQQIIYNYQWFHDQYGAIKAQAANVKILPEGSREQYGAKMVLNRAIEEYNSRSRQITRNLWKSSSLPYEIKLEGL